MGYSIDGLGLRGTFEFPHTSLYDSDLSELLRMYKILVEDYQILLDEIITAHKLYDEAKDFVEQQERIFLDNQTKMMRRFKEVMDEANRLQQALVEWFKETTAEMREENKQLEDMFNQMNADTLKEMHDYFEKAIAEFREERKHWEDTFENTMNKWNLTLNIELDRVTEKIQENYDAFRLYIGTEFDVLISLMTSTDDSISEYFTRVRDLCDTLESQYVDLLARFETGILDKFDSKLDEQDDEWNTKYNEFMQSVKDEFDKTNKRIEEAANTNIEIQTDKIRVFSPVTHKIKKLQWTLDEMYIYFRAWAISAAEYDAIGITAEEYDNYVGNLGLYPAGIGIAALDYDALGRWILLEKPDILEQVKGDIEQITYDKLNENADRITQEITDKVEANLNNRMDALEQALNDTNADLTEVKDALDKLTQLTTDGLTETDNNIGNIIAAILNLQEIVLNVLT